MTANELVATLSQLFTVFDSLAEKHGVEQVASPVNSTLIIVW